MFKDTGREVNKPSRTEKPNNTRFLMGLSKPQENERYLPTDKKMEENWHRDFKEQHHLIYDKTIGELRKRCTDQQKIINDKKREYSEIIEIKGLNEAKLQDLELKRSKKRVIIEHESKKVRDINKTLNELKKNGDDVLKSDEEKIRKAIEAKKEYERLESIRNNLYKSKEEICKRREEKVRNIGNYMEESVAQYLSASDLEIKNIYREIDLNREPSFSAWWEYSLAKIPVKEKLETLEEINKKQLKLSSEKDNILKEIQELREDISKIDRPLIRDKLNLETLDQRAKSCEHELKLLKEKFQKDFGMPYNHPDQENRLKNIAKQEAKKIAWAAAEEALIEKLRQFPQVLSGQYPLFDHSLVQERRKRSLAAESEESQQSHSVWFRERIRPENEGTVGSE